MNRCRGGWRPGRGCGQLGGLGGGSGGGAGVRLAETKATPGGKDLERRQHVVKEGDKSVGV